uniref:Phorbol-ester/DAG-type domain-containing protein n=1 Tax=Ditylenchus dipsaci TaxID=166011 RepID=A0A915EJ32_9BILA
MDHLFPAQPPPPIPTQQAQTQAGVMVANQFNDFLAPAIPTSISAFNLALQQAPQQQQSQRNQIITISMQYGSHKELVIVERSNDPQLFQFFRQKARQMVERQLQSAASSANGNYAEGVAASPSSSTTSFFQSQQQYQPPAMAALPPSFSVPIAELQLFMHDYRSPNMLEHLTNLAQLDNGSIVEIIRIDRRNEHPTRLHCLGVNSYKTPLSQGLQCSLCKCNFHKKCAFAPRNNCAKNEINTNPATGQFANLIPEDLNQTAKLPSPPAVNATIPQFQLPHTLSMHNYKTPTVCKVCDKMLLGLIKQGMKCRDCKVNVHKKCAVLLPMNCQITADNAITHTSTNELDQESLDSNAQDAMIPLARLPGSASSRGANRQGPLCEGWMIHFLLQPASSQPKGWRNAGDSDTTGY